MSSSGALSRLASLADPAIGIALLPKPASRLLSELHSQKGMTVHDGKA
jgi:hypothetical protein